MLPTLAVVCPPLAVLAVRGLRAATVNLGLTCLLYVPGVRHALRAVDQHEATRRYDAMVRAMGLQPA